MRGNLSVLLVMCCAVICNSQDYDPESIRWHHDLKSGWVASQQADRLMMIFVTSEGCHYCDQLDRDTWASEAVADCVTQEFVAVRLKLSKHRAIIRQLGVKSFPTVLIADPTGKVINHHAGYLSAEGMIQFIVQNSRGPQIDQPIAIR